jgi:hypothetical protein
VGVRGPHEGESSAMVQRRHLWQSRPRPAFTRGA